MDHIIPSRNPIPPSRRPLEMASVWWLAVTVIGSLLLFIPSATIQVLPTKSFVVAFAAVIALILYIVARLGRGNVIVPPLALLGALWLPVIGYVLSALFSDVRFLTAIWGTGLETDTLGFMLAITVLGTVATLALRNADHYRALLKAFFAAGALLIAVEVLIIVLGQFAPGSLSPTFAIAGAFNDLSMLFGLIVVGILITFRNLELSMRMSRWLWVGLAAALILLGLLGTTLVWILVALMALGLFVEANMKRRSGSTDIDLEDSQIVSEKPTEPTEEANGSLVTPLVVLIIALFFAFAGNVSGILAHSLNLDVLSVRPSWQATLTVLNKTYTAEPLFGSGPSTFTNDWVKYRGSALNSTVFWNIDFPTAVGFLPTSFVTTGALGIAFWLAFLALFLFFGLRTLIFRAPADPFVRFVSFLSFAAATYLLTCAMFDTPGPAVLALTFIFIGLFISTLRYAEGGGQWGIVFSKAPKLSFGIVVVLTLVLLGSVAASYPLIERYASWVLIWRGEAALAAGNLTVAENSAQGASSLAATPRVQNLKASIAVARLSTILANPPADATTAQQQFQGILSEGIQAALSATKGSPDQYQYWITLGTLYSYAVPFKVPGAYENAKVAFTKAVELNPSSPQIPYLMAQVEIAHQNYAAAEAQLQTAINRKQDYAPAILLLSQLEVTNGKLDAALSAAEAGAYFTPNDPNILFQVGILRAAAGKMAGASDALNAAVKVSPSFANARYFLAATLAKQKNFPAALEQIQAIAAMSEANAAAVENVRASLAAGKDPFPANLLSAPQTALQ